jgi:hypothetical protein
MGERHDRNLEAGGEPNHTTDPEVHHGSTAKVSDNKTTTEVDPLKPRRDPGELFVC